jgi:hypothetical protein
MGIRVPRGVIVGDKPQNGRLTKIISNTVFINIMSPRMCRIENLGLCRVAEVRS